MNGENRFSVRNVIKTAWHNVKGTKWPIWAPQIVMFLIYIGVAFVFGILGTLTNIIPRPGIAIGIDFFVGLIIFEIVVIFLVSPLLAGIQMVGLKRIRGEPVEASAGFKYWHKWLPLGFTVLFFTIGNIIINQILSLLIKASSMVPILIILFSILLAVATLLYVTFFMFNMLFVADKNKGPWRALGHSAKMVAPHWFRVLLLFIYICVVAAIMLLPAILGLLCPVVEIKILGILVSIVLMIWALPYWNLIIATTFHQLSGNKR